jgi:hypothetical protein
MSNGKKKRKSKSAQTTRPASVRVEVDRALKKRWTALAAEVEDARREGASAFDRMWEAVAEIVEHEPPLYLAGGFATAKAYYAAKLGESERTARRCMRVAKYASPAEEARYGPSKLDLALNYIEASAGGPVKRRVPVDFAKLRIPVERDGRSQAISLDEATAEEIAAATRALVRGAGRSAARTSPLVRAIVERLTAAPLRKIKVRFAGGKISLSGIAPEALRALGQGLARVKLPGDD